MEDNKRQFFKNATPEVQDENFELFVSLVKDLKEDSYYLSKVFSDSDRNVLKKHSLELAEVMSENKENLIVIENIWKFLDKECQKQKISILKYAMNELLMQDEKEDSFKIWKATDYEIQEMLLNEFLDRYDDKEKNNLIFKGLNGLLSQENFETMLAKNGVLVDDIEDVYRLYHSIFKMNKNVNETIDLNMFDSKILGVFDLEKLARITTYPEVQSKIVEYSKVPGFCSVMGAIDDDNWVMELDGVLKNIDNYPELFDDISKEEIDEKSAKRLVQVFSQRENYFNISTVAEARNYFEIKKDICLKILNNEMVENLSPMLEQYSDEERKRFAILEMMYGIDIEEARNLIEKYGKDIDKIDVDKYGRNVIVLKGIKRILECENIGEKYEENKSIIDNELEEIHYENIADLEKDCTDMYAQMYQEILYHPQESQKLGTVEYEGTKIKVYEVQGDFNMFVRAEGACDNTYDEPESFAEKLDNPSTQYHGNCKSFIRQDSIGIANSKGVKFGYSRCENGTLLLSAPWDIMSNGANTELSTASEKWSTNCGIQFRTPEEMINHTRHSYNEFDFEKLIYDEENHKFEGDKPQYIIYVKEPETDRKSDDKWRISKKAAAQMNLPIVILDREKNVQKEWERMQELQDILVGKLENKDNISESDLIENIVLKFENNVNSVKGSKILESKYFTGKQRQDMVNNIVKYIKSIENVDFDKYQKLFNKFRDVVQGEVDKTISNTGISVAVDKYGLGFLNALRQKCSMIEVERSKRDLKEAYKRNGIETSDLSKARKFLENEKDKEHNLSVRNR